MSRFYAAYGFRSASFYLALPIGALLLSRDELGQFFYYLAIMYLISTLSTLGLNSYLLRKSYNSSIVDLIFWRASGLVLVIYGISMLVITAWRPGFIVVLLASAIRALSLISESRLLALGARNIVSSAYFVYGLIFVVVALIGCSVFADHRSLLIAAGAAEGAVVVAALRARPRSGSTRLFMRHIGNRETWRIEFRGITYGLPILMAGVFNLSLNSADRLIIEFFGTFGDVAMFSMMYSLAVASNRFIMQPANLRMTSRYLRGQAEKPVISALRAETSMVLVIVTAWAVAMTLVGNRVLGLFGPEYVVNPVNYLLIGTSAIALTAFTLSTMHIKRSKSPRALIPLLAFAAISNLVLSILLVPLLGFLGASFSTFIAYWSLYFVAGISIGRSGVVEEGVLLLCVGVVLVLAIILSI